MSKCFENTGTMDDPVDAEFAQYLFPALVDRWKEHTNDNEVCILWCMSIWIEVIEKLQSAGNAFAQHCRIVKEQLYCHQMNRLYTLGIVQGTLRRGPGGGEQSHVFLSKPSWPPRGPVNKQVEASADIFARTYVDLVLVAV